MEELIKHMFAHINKQKENPGTLEGGFTLNQIMHLQIKLIRRSSYIKLPKWTEKTKAVINPKVAMNSVLNEQLLQHYSLLQHDENRYNWRGPEFPLAIHRIGMFYL